MVEKNVIALRHPAEIISRGKIAHAGPLRSAISNKVAPRIIGWFLFHEPE